MPALPELLAKRAGLILDFAHDTADVLETELLEHMPIFDKRIYIPCCNESSPPGLVEAETVDPWQKSGKYALAWVYFAILLLAFTTAIRWYHLFNDKIRTTLHEESIEKTILEASPNVDILPSTLSSLQSTRKLISKEQPLPAPTQEVSPSWIRWPGNVVFALSHFIFYRPIPNLRRRKQSLIQVLAYDLIPQPLYWQSIRFGSPPIAIRAGMLAIATMPWIIAVAMKANFISMMTGIGHERLNVLYRWLAYTFLLLSLIHTIPFYITPIWKDGGDITFRSFFSNPHVYVYGSGVAALVPTTFLCVHSLPPLRRKFYELFTVIHVPMSFLLLGTLFWHCNNYLASWDYLFVTSGIWMASYIVRLFYLNWTNPWRMSWLIGDEAAVTLLPENAVKVTIPTQMRWKPGQHVYLRMPGVSFFENHPFTIASLCSDDFPSEYGEKYRDMVLVFRPFAGFTKEVVEAAAEHGPWKTYRVFLDGPCGGMRRIAGSFDHVVMIAGGSGITAVMSQLLDLVKRMRDGEAVTRTVHLIWALKHPEAIEWFREELRICQEFAPPGSVQCRLYATAAKRRTMTGQLVSVQTLNRPVSMAFHGKFDAVFQSVASNRFSISSQRDSGFIKEITAGDAEREKELREEDIDRLRPLPEAHLRPPPTPHFVPPSLSALEGSQSPGFAPTSPIFSSQATPHLPPRPTFHAKRRSHNLSLDISAARRLQHASLPAQQQLQQQPRYPASASSYLQDSTSSFGFPSTPIEIQENLTCFAFMPATVKQPQRSGWSVEWGRPEIGFLLGEMSKTWTGGRACVFVCGPPRMRVDASSAVAGLQKMVLGREMEEVYLCAENYAL